MEEVETRPGPPDGPGSEPGPRWGHLDRLELSGTPMGRRSAAGTDALAQLEGHVHVGAGVGHVERERAGVDMPKSPPTHTGGRRRPASLSCPEQRPCAEAAGPVDRSLQQGASDALAASPNSAVRSSPPGSRSAETGSVSGQDTCVSHPRAPGRSIRCTHSPPWMASSRRCRPPATAVHGRARSSALARKSPAAARIRPRSPSSALAGTRDCPGDGRGRLSASAPARPGIRRPASGIRPGHARSRMPGNMSKHASTDAFAQP
jgi:hypothetical protein